MFVNYLVLRIMSSMVRFALAIFEGEVCSIVAKVFDMGSQKYESFVGDASFVDGTLPLMFRFLALA